jgi:hypothetical protein
MEQFADLEQVIRFVMVMNRDQLELVNQTVNQATAKMQGAMTAAAVEGERTRTELIQASVEKQFAHFEKGFQQQIAAAQQAADLELRIYQEKVERQIRMAAAGVDREGAVYRKHTDEVMAQQTRLEEHRKKIAEKVKEAQTVYDADPKRTKEANDAAILAQQEKEKAATKEANEAATQRLRNLAGDNPDAEQNRSLRNRGVGWRSFDLARDTARGLAGGDEMGKMTGAGIGIGENMLKGILGLTNPVTALLGVASGIKDLVLAGHELNIKRAQDQLKLIGGTAELARRASAEEREVGGGMKLSKAATAASEAAAASKAFVGKEAEMIPGVIRDVTAGAPGFDPTDKAQVGEVTSKIFSAARQLGMGADEVAKIVSQLARQGGDASTAGVLRATQQIERINAIAVSMAEKTGQIDPQKMIKSAMTLHEQLIPFGVSLEDAARLTFKFGKELERGQVSLVQLAEQATGLRKQDAGSRAYFGQFIKGKSAEEAQAGGYGDVHKALQQVTRPEDIAVVVRGLLEGTASSGMIKAAFPEMKNAPDAEVAKFAKQLQSQMAGAGMMAFRDDVESKVGGRRGGTELAKMAYTEGMWTDWGLKGFGSGAESATGSDPRMKMLGKGAPDDFSRALDAASASADSLAVKMREQADRHAEAAIGLSDYTRIMKLSMFGTGGAGALDEIGRQRARGMISPEQAADLEAKAVSILSDRSKRSNENDYDWRARQSKELAENVTTQLTINAAFHAQKPEDQKTQTDLANTIKTALTDVLKSGTIDTISSIMGSSGLLATGLERLAVMSKNAGAR